MNIPNAFRGNCVCGRWLIVPDTVNSAMPMVCECGARCYWDDYNFVLLEKESNKSLWLSNLNKAKTASDIMHEIMNLDVKPDVFRVNVSCTDNYTGFTAWVSFRTNHTNTTGVREIGFHGKTAEEALQDLRDNLELYFGKCDCCGGYRSGEEK